MNKYVTGTFHQVSTSYIQELGQENKHCIEVIQKLLFS